MTDTIPVEQFDLSVREQLDADSLVYELLSSDDYGSLGTPFVQAEVDLTTDAKSMISPVVLYSCGSPKQFTSNLKAWYWRFPLTVTVMCMDAEKAFRMAAKVSRNIAKWPWRDAVSDGSRVSRVPDNAGFHRVAPGDVTNSKSVHVFVADKVIQASTVRDGGV